MKLFNKLAAHVLSDPKPIRLRGFEPDKTMLLFIKLYFKTIVSRCKFINFHQIINRTMLYVLSFKIFEENFPILYVHGCYAKKERLMPPDPIVMCA